MSFDKLPLRLPREDLCLEALKLENIEKNRYVDCIPTDLHMVRLEGGEYINASWVDVGVDKRVIATQGPLESTIQEFWKMIRQYGCKTIVMLTDLFVGKDLGTNKCAKYWPLLGEKEFGVENVKEERVDGLLKITTLKVDGVSDPVTHLQFLWRDQGCPENLSLLIDRLKGIEYPFVCHCSAGIGRTGTLLAILRMMNTGESAYESVSFIRGQRNGMVQTEEQFVFVDNFLKTF